LGFNGGGRLTSPWPDKHAEEPHVANKARPKKRLPRAKAVLRNHTGLGHRETANKSVPRTKKGPKDQGEARSQDRQGEYFTSKFAHAKVFEETSRDALVVKTGKEYQTSHWLKRRSAGKKTRGRQGIQGRVRRAKKKKKSLGRGLGGEKRRILAGGGGEMGLAGDNLISNTRSESGRNKKTEWVEQREGHGRGLWGAGGGKTTNAHQR